jgi:pimeloyl-ACP methyl ester carboxylesterase
MTAIPLIDPPLRSMTLADGRTLTWQEFGRPDGRPVLYFHGGGSTSIEGGIFHREAMRGGIRLIATNRPGARGSSLRPGRPVAAYADDLEELLDELDVSTIACFGESNGGMFSMAAAAALPGRVSGAVPINPTLPWFDPQARRVSSRAAGLGYWLIKNAPSLVAAMTSRSDAKLSQPPEKAGAPIPAKDVVGPPPGTESEIADLQRRTMRERVDKPALYAELTWATHDWGFDYYTIPVRLDFFCGEHDVQGPFARVLAERNPDAAFHEFAYGHSGFSHPDARRRIVDVVAEYVAS